MARLYSNRYLRITNEYEPSLSDPAVTPERPRKVSRLKPVTRRKAGGEIADVFSGALDANLPQIPGQLSLFPDQFCDVPHKGLTKKQANCD